MFLEELKLEGKLNPHAFLLPYEVVITSND
jgi:hypothetical protein